MDQEKQEPVVDQSTTSNTPSGEAPDTSESPPDAMSSTEIDSLLSDDEDVAEEFMAEDSEQEEGREVESPPAQVAPSPAAPDVQAEPVASTPSPVPPVQPQPQEQPAPVQAEAIAPSQPSPANQEVPRPAAEPASQSPTRDELRARALVELEKRYALTEDDATAVLSEPEKVLPQFFSKLYVDIYENVLNSLQVALPQMVSQVQASESVASQNERDFYAAWPKLQEHTQMVERFGQMYRQMNPQATKEQFINDVGAQAMVALKLPIEGVTQPAAQPESVVRVPPYTPPRGGPTPAPQGPRPVNPWAQMAEEFEEDDLGIGSN